MTPSASRCVSTPGGPSASVTHSIAGPPSIRSGSHAAFIASVTACVELGLMTRMRSLTLRVPSVAELHARLLDDGPPAVVFVADELRERLRRAVMHLSAEGFDALAHVGELDRARDLSAHTLHDPGRHSARPGDAAP